MRRTISLFNLKITKLLKLLMLLVILSVETFALGDANEYNIKAMFILNFMKYIEWPACNSSSKFKIGVAGDSDIYDALVSMSNNRKENGNIEIDKVQINSTEHYQIIIIPSSENNQIKKWYKKYQGMGVLIITEESKHYAYSTINLLNIDNKIRFEINNSHAHTEGIKISSRLSELAVTVHP